MDKWHKNHTKIFIEWQCKKESRAKKNNSRMEIRICHNFVFLDYSIERYTYKKINGIYGRAMTYS